jgi:glycosyltransferase involved in cell wall biosynthesis
MNLDVVRSEQRSGPTIACRSLEELSIIHIVPAIDAEASGPSYSVPRLCESLAARGCKTALLTTGSGPSVHSVNYSHHSYPISKSLGRFYASGPLQKALIEKAGTADILHNHSLWLMPNVYPAAAAQRWRKPLMISPRGTLSPVALRRSWLQKKIFWMLLQGRAVRAAACFHATSLQEYQDIRRAGLQQPVAIVPNGVDIPPDAGRQYRPGPRTLLYLGRLHPIKGLDNLLRAWQGIGRRFRDWQLRLVGPDEGGYRADLERLAGALKLERLEFAGPRYGADKRGEYAAADVFVLPSHTENFGMNVAEALAQGVPVITTRATPWGAMPAQGCGWYVADDASALEGALSEALALDRPALERMGGAGRAWMERDFSWSRIAQNFEAVYKWLSRGGLLPASVRLD